MPRPADWEPAPHGTAARYLYHITHNDPPCDPCKTANAAKTRRYRQENLEKIRALDRDRVRLPENRASERLKKYGLTLKSYNNILKAQDGKCAICRDDFTPARGPQIDHDHHAGHTRGILCFQCNVGLGNFYDSPSLLRAAADYLERHSATDQRPAAVGS